VAAAPQRTHHSTTFLIQCDQAVCTHGMTQIAGELLQLVFILHIAPEQADCADMVITHECGIFRIQRQSRHTYHYQLTSDATCFLFVNDDVCLLIVCCHFTAPSIPRIKKR
jgi:hypothetical protein